MMRPYSASLCWAPFLIALLFSILPISTVSAQTSTGLPTGCHLATEADKSAGGANIVVGVTNICPPDVKAGINADVGAAKDYLNNLPKRPLSQCAPPTQANIQRLNNGFAVCAAAFFKAYTAKYGTVYITSAFRDNTPGSAPNGKQSANQCAGGAPRSRHALGLAIDVNPASESLYPTMWKFAEENPQFGVCFPYQDGKRSGYFDRPHMTLAGGSGREALLCANQGVTKPCAAGASFTPTYPGTGGAAQPSAPGGSSTPAPTQPQIPLPPTRDIGGSPSCPSDYILFEGQCFPYPEEAIPMSPAGTCPPGLESVTVQDYETGTPYKTCVEAYRPNTCPSGYTMYNGQCTPISSGPSSCTSGYYFAGFIPLDIRCNQPQQQTFCPQGYLLVNNQCVPFSQNQYGTPLQSGLPQMSGVPAGSQYPGSSSQGGYGVPGSGSVGVGAVQCTPRTICQNNVVYYQNSACATQVYQTCVYGCSLDGSACSTTTATTSTSTLVAQVLARLNPTAITPTNVAQNGHPTDSIGVIQIPGLGTIANLNGSLIASQPVSYTGSGYGAPPSVIPGNTFGQTGNWGSVMESTLPQLSILQDALFNIQRTLLGILSYLRLSPTPRIQ